MANHDAHGEHHHIPVTTHYKVFAALIGFTILTVVTAKMMDFGAFNAIIAFAIAISKALLVLGYFMHLKFDEKIYKYIIGSSFFFVFLLYVFCVLDIGTRILQQNTL